MKFQPMMSFLNVTAAGVSEGRSSRAFRAENPLVRCFLITLGATGLVAQTSEHTAAVLKAQGAAYAYTERTNRCPIVDTDMFGWPKNLVRYCEYAKWDAMLGHKRKAMVYLLEVKPDIIALWIESACDQLRKSAANCFDKVLVKGRDNSGYMFPIAGNILEDMRRPNEFRNYFFRNGMTVAFRRGVNDSAAELSVEDQRLLSLMPNESALSIPSGFTRFWLTTPAIFCARFPISDAPLSLDNAESRMRWLDIARKEMLGALSSNSNRLLESWLCANAQDVLDDKGASCEPGVASDQE